MEEERSNKITIMPSFMQRLSIDSQFVRPRRGPEMLLNTTFDGTGEPWEDVGIDQAWEITGGAARYPVNTTTTTNELRQACALGISGQYGVGQLFELTYTLYFSSGTVEFYGIQDGWIPMVYGTGKKILFHGDGFYEFCVFRASPSATIQNLDNVSIRAVL